MILVNGLKESGEFLCNDLAFQRGYAAFEFLRTYGKSPFAVSEHLDRLFMSADMLQIAHPFSKESVAKWIEEVIDEEDIGIKIYITPGKDFKTPQCIVLKAMLHVPSQEEYENGVEACTTLFPRFLPLAKSTNYTAAFHALRSVPTAKEVIYLDGSGNVLEGGTSNIFCVKDGVVFTAGSGVLFGITRKYILDLFPQIREKATSLDDLDECFLTSTTREVLAITSIDGKKVGNGAVGPLTKQIAAKFSLFIQASFYREKIII